MKAPLLFTLATIALGATLVSCGSDEEDTPNATPTATPSPTTTLAPGGGGGDLPLTVVPPPHPWPSNQPIPTDWLTYRNTDRPGFSFRYPDTWHMDPDPQASTIRSWDQTTQQSEPLFPTGGIAVQYAAQLLPSDPKELEPPQGSTETKLAGISGWEIVYTREAGAGDWNRFHQVWADRNGYRFWLGGYFAQKDADEGILLQMVKSLTLLD